MYLRRFLKLSNPSLKLVLDSVDVILNGEVENRFKHAEQELNNSLGGIDELTDKVVILCFYYKAHLAFQSCNSKKSDLQRQYLSSMLTSKNLHRKRKSNPMAVWHGANKKHIDSIIWYGMQNLSSNDPGEPRNADNDITHNLQIMQDTLGKPCTSLNFPNMVNTMPKHVKKGNMATFN